MSRIAKLWQAGKAPAVDGLYRVDGSARVVEVDGPELARFNLGPPLYLDRLLTIDSDYVTEIDISVEAELANEGGLLCCGGGALGSDGFFARLDPSRNLTWLVALTSSNPFVAIVVNGSRAIFTNNLGNSITVDLASPDYS